MSGERPINHDHKGGQVDTSWMVALNPLPCSMTVVEETDHPMLMSTWHSASHYGKLGRSTEMPKKMQAFTG